MFFIYGLDIFLFVFVHFIVNLLYCLNIYLDTYTTLVFFESYVLLLNSKELLLVYVVWYLKINKLN